jgi:hypothetical protein
VERAQRDDWRSVKTDRSGVDAIHGLLSGTSDVSVGKEGYETSYRRFMTVTGDTRLDVQLVRR